jgi:hypothetical protein
MFGWPHSIDCMSHVGIILVVWVRISTCVVLLFCSVSAKVPVKITSTPTKCRGCRVARRLKTRESINKVSACVQKIVPHFTQGRSRSRHCATSPKDAVFHCLWGPWDFKLTILLATPWPVVQLSLGKKRVTLCFSWGGGSKGGRCVVLTTLPPSCADCLEILGASTSWHPQGLSRTVIG